MIKIIKPVTISGTVTRFKGNGRRLGYPTANLTVKTNLADGVYFGLANLSKWSNNSAIVFIGVPTTMGDTERRIEAYLLDIPDEDYYDQHLDLKVHYYHRPNKTFDSVAELLRVMRADEAAARQWFASNSIT